MNDLLANDGLLREIEDCAVDWARQAGQMALDSFWRPLQVEYKQENRVDPVTQADRGIETFLKAAIAERFPEHGILGEEGTEVEVAQRELLWVLDPLDGTNNFVNGLPLFASSLGVLHRGIPVAGAIFLPVAPGTAHFVTDPGTEARRPKLQLRSAVLHARLGGGAFLDADPVRASDAPAPEASSLSGLPGLHAHQFHRLEKLRGKPGEIRCLGSVCFETAMVATGAFRYALFRRPRLWDVAAGMLIVREAAGQVLTWSDGGWQPFSSFQPMSNPKRPAESGLRFWQAVTLMGGSRVASFVADRLRPTAPRPKKG